MKKVLALSLLTLFSAQLCLAGFRVPKFLHTADTLEKAKQEAADQGKILLILYSDPNST